ncbi:MAG: hypothetical protein JXP34_10010, partial [Planctomycetes bacterium]|nr:hypothetical protein [Planctomycetota bacterium]
MAAHRYAIGVVGIGALVLSSCGTPSAQVPGGERWIPADRGDVFAVQAPAGAMGPVPTYVGSAEHFAVHVAFRAIDPADLRALALWGRRAGEDWARVGEALIADLPLRFAPAEEGAYDLRVSRIRADGGEDGAPGPDDPPILRLVVDRTPPAVMWGPVEDARAGARATIRFRVEEAMLPEDPRAAVLWSPAGEEWMRIAEIPIRAGDNEAEIPVPPRPGDENRLRLVVGDRAGNSAEASPPQSFAIIGAPEPGRVPAVARPGDVGTAPATTPPEKADASPVAGPLAAPVRLVFQSLLEDTVVAAGTACTVSFEAAGWEGCAGRLAWRQAPDRPWEVLEDPVDLAVGKAAWRAPLGETLDGRLRLEVVRDGEVVAAQECPGKVIVDPEPPVVTFGEIERDCDGQPSLPVAAEDALSGVASLSAYLSRDGGASWRPVPLEGGRIALPAEAGSFGIRVASRDGAGNEVPSPRSGDTPESTVRLGPPARLALENFHGGMFRGESRAKIFWAFQAPGAEPVPLRLESVASDGNVRAIADLDATRGGFLWTLPRTSGAYRIRLRASLPDGSTIVCASREPFSVDADAPSIAVDSRSIDAAYVAEVAAEVSDDGPAGLSDVALLIRRAGETAWTEARRIDRRGTRIRAFVGDLPEGEHVLRVRARDGAGNETVAPEGGIPLRVDRTPPAIVLRDVTRDGGAAVVVAAEDAGGIREIALDVSADGGPWKRARIWRGGARPPARVEVPVPDVQDVPDIPGAPGKAIEIAFRARAIDRAGNAIETSTPPRRLRPEETPEPEASPVPVSHHEVDAASRAASERAFLQLEDLERREETLDPGARAERVRIIEKNLLEALRIDADNARAYVGLALL